MKKGYAVLVPPVGKMPGQTKEEKERESYVWIEGYRVGWDAALKEIGKIAKKRKIRPEWVMSEKEL